MAKSLDGVKKLNPDDIKKYRKMVLDYIGEGDSAGVNAQKEINKGAASLKKVDGINLNKISSIGRRVRAASEDSSAKSGFVSNLFSSKKDGASKIRSSDGAGSAEAIRQEELKKQEITEQIKREVEETRLAEEAKKLAEKIKLEELGKKEKLRIKENLRLEKIKREEEIKRIKREAEITAQSALGEKRVKRQKALRLFKRHFSLKAKNLYSIIKRKVIYAILLLVLGLAIVYTIFCLLVLRLKIDNNIINQTLKYLPIPAAITSQGVISYNDFKKIESKNYLSLNLSEKKNYLVKWVILGELKQKYGLANNFFINDLAIKYVLDRDFNQGGISRINKINELLRGQSDIEPLSRYADKYEGGVYYSPEEAAEKFGPVVLKLIVGQISNIIPRVDGYYIIKRIDDKDNQLGVKYLFIRAETLDQYVNKKLDKAFVFILAN